MSKMTKTQVTHLKARLVEALRKAAKDKYTPVDLKPADIEAEQARIRKLIGYTGNGTYNLRGLAMDSLRGEVDVYKLNCAKQLYMTHHSAKIEEIIDTAILGDSTEALQALKDFKESL